MRTAAMFAGRQLLKGGAAAAAVKTAAPIVAPKTTSKVKLALGGSALLGTALLAWNTVMAEEKPSPIFKKEEVEVFAVIGPPLCGKATQAQRLARRFDFLLLGPEDDFFTEIATHQVSARGTRLRVIMNGFPKTLDEAAWFEEEICPIAAIVFIDCPPEKAIARTQERAYSAVKGGHKLFKKETEGLIAEFRKRGNFLEIDGAADLQSTWKQIEAKVDQALELSKRNELI